VRLVGTLVAREADVAVQPVEAAATRGTKTRCGIASESRSHRAAAPGQHGRDDLLVPGGAVRLEPVAVVVLAERREELEPLLRKSSNVTLGQYLK